MKLKRGLFAVSRPTIKILPTQMTVKQKVFFSSSWYYKVQIQLSVQIDTSNFIILYDWKYKLLYKYVSFVLHLYSTD